MANNKYQNIQLLWTNTLDNPPKPEDLELGQPLINVREGIETLYFRNEKGDGLIEFIGKNSIVDLINEKSANKVHSIIGEKGINSVEDKDDEGNKIVRLSVKMDDNVANRATINDKGLFVSNITDCGTF